jgi:hypothetical protein
MALRVKDLICTEATSLQQERGNIPYMILRLCSQDWDERMKDEG